jgi:hypothetical protein
VRQALRSEALLVVMQVRALTAARAMDVYSSMNLIQSRFAVHGQSVRVRTALAQVTVNSIAA